MKTWEYRVATVEGTPGSKVEAGLKTLGGEGWELVSVTTEPRSERSGYKYLFWFKREKTADSPYRG